MDTQENPADLLSRGVALDKLVDEKLWWHGPGFLRNYELWPRCPLDLVPGPTDVPPGRLGGPTDCPADWVASTTQIAPCRCALSANRFRSSGTCQMI